MVIKGFSLLELVVVLGIIAALAAIAVPTYQSYSAKAKAAPINTLIGKSLDKLRQHYDIGSVVNEASNLNSIPGLDSIIITYDPSSVLSDNYVEIRLAEVTGIAALLDEGLFLRYSPSLVNGKIVFTCTLVFPLPGLTQQFVASYFPSCV